MWDVDMRWNWDSVVVVATGLINGLYGVRISAMLRDWFFSSPKVQTSSCALTQWVLGGSFVTVRRTEIDVVHSPPSSAEIKNERRYTSTLPMDRNSFSFTFIHLRNKYFTMVDYTHFMCFMYPTQYTDSHANYLLFNLSRTCQNGSAFDKVKKIW